MRSLHKKEKVPIFRIFLKMKKLRLRKGPRPDFNVPWWS